MHFMLIKTKDAKHFLGNPIKIQKYNHQVIKKKNPLEMAA